jgi:hypothetical protein
MAKKASPSSAAAGYSGKSLIDKLGWKEGAKAIVVAPPANYVELVDGAAIKPVASLPKAGAFDFIHLFVLNAAAMKAAEPKLDGLLAAGGMVWVSWPKKTSAMFRDLTEDGIRTIVLPPGKLVDVKVCAVDADWSGLKLYRRKAK